MTVAEWLKMAKADAEQRGGPELVALLDGLARATEALRAADWNDGRDAPEASEPEGRSNRLRQGYGESAEADSAQVENLPRR